MYTLMFTKDAIKDYKLIMQKPALKKNVNQLLEILETDPYKNPLPFKKLKGNLSNVYSRRINIQHRLVYLIDAENKRIKIISLFTHYY